MIKKHKIKIHHDIIASVNTSILSVRADKFILRIRESDGFHYWLYNALGDLTEIEGPSAKIFKAAGLSDSLAIVLFSDHDSTLFMTKYDYINDIRDANENLTTSCNFLYSVTNVIRLSGNLFFNSQGIKEFHINNYMKGQALRIDNLAHGVYFYLAISTTKNVLTGKILIIK
ncbi:MAG: hypothetical protein IPM26_11230 [Saprospiraceae bacterium]|nr:hypothetical protein [Saprospiraceae bacterium]